MVHCPLFWQVMVVSPFALVSASQIYVLTAPSVVSPGRTVALAIVGGIPQSAKITNIKDKFKVNTTLSP